MKPYTHFTPEERICLEVMRKKRIKISEIAKSLKRDRSSIYRELKRNQSREEYSAVNAILLYRKRRKKSVRAARIKPDTDIYRFIRKRLKKYWSPELISEKWNRSHKDDRISFATIYRAVKNGSFGGITPRNSFRRRGKPVTRDRSRFNTIQPDHTIHEWSEETKLRLRHGDWEGDTLRGSPGKGGLLTLVDRRSRYLTAILINSFSSKTLKSAVIRACEGKQIKSITLDNGSEFALFREFEKELDTTVYFADPHSPWQRGSNENMNGLLRFWFPKGFDFHTISQADVDRVVDLINSRPRACLNFRSPKQVFCCT
ncbi:MAG: IS30 family transposase [Clostridia bacterium]|nr:IS30 family transposase [Clostridia bacterium]